MSEEKLGKKKFVSIVLFALLGQIAWAIENAFLNLFIDRTISTNAFAISFMVAASAIVATLTTLFVGIRVDKLGKRVPFMTWGYFLWGISIMAFSLITVKNVSALFNIPESKAVNIAAFLVVLLDCIMTFIGSSANDAAFNAWVTDNTNTHNRSTVESILSVMGAVGMATVFGFDLIGGVTQNKYYDASGNQVDQMVEGGSVVYGNWTLFFCFFGVLVLVLGIIGRFILEDSKDLKPNPESSYKNVLYGFKPSVMKKYKLFYLTLLAMTILGIASNVTAPYLLIYMERTLGYKYFIIPAGFAVGGSMVCSVIFSYLLDKKGNKEKFLIPGIITLVAGDILLCIVSPLLFEHTPVLLFIPAMFVMALGGALTNIILNSSLRDYTPKNNVGQFQGVRMVFFIMLPMCIGPFITAFLNVSGISNQAGTDAFGNAIYNYSPYMFLISAVISILAVIPVIFLLKNIKQQKAGTDMSAEKAEA